MNSVVMPMRPRGSRAKKLTFDRAAAVIASSNRAADVGRRVQAVDLAQRHFQPLAEQQHGFAAAANACEKLAEVSERVEHRERTLFALQIAAR